MGQNIPKIGITIGDLNGIGVEVIMKTFIDDRVLNMCTPIIYGSSKALSYHRNIFQMNDFKFNIIPSVEEARSGAVNVINCWDEPVPLKIGHPDKSLGQFAMRSLKAAAYDVVQGRIQAVVTAPVNKAHLCTDSKIFVGQTEFFSEACGGRNSMMFLVSDNIKVGLVTNHIPISEVASAINKEIILKKLGIMNQSLQEDFQMQRPKIAVLALNPHAGDEGLIGKEDDEIVGPAVKEAKEKGLLVFGPYAADGFFGSGTYRQFDAILSMYHDQGLVPFKALSFGHGVNVTTGLPIVRTSPDHGTAYNIAGKNVANPDSFREAVYRAIDIYRNRLTFKEMLDNPMKKSKLKADDPNATSDVPVS